jgi:hypothetical protein
VLITVLAMRLTSAWLLVCAGLGCADAANNNHPGDLGTPQQGVDGGLPGEVDGSSGGHQGGVGHAGSGGGSGGSSADGEGCEELVIRAKPNAPDVLIVLDRSGSMMGVDVVAGGSGTIRWPGCIAALKSVTAQFEERIRFGLMMFPAFSTSPLDLVPFSCSPGKMDVRISLGTASMIASALDAALPTTGGTPTPETLRIALNVLGDRTPIPDQIVTPAYVLLVTDGKPTCPNGGGASENTQDVTLTLQALDALLNANIPTYVIGYDTASISPLLDSFAMHGGTHKHYAVDNEAALVQEFSRIAGDLVSCSYELESEPPDPTYVLVEIDGQPVRLNAADGWVLNGKSIDLQGAACKTLRSSEGHVVNVVRKCDPVVVL